MNHQNYVTISLTLNEIVGEIPRNIRFHVNKVYNTYEQMVRNVADTKFPSYTLCMHDPIQTDECWVSILKFYDDSDYKYVGNKI